MFISSRYLKVGMRRVQRKMISPAFSLSSPACPHEDILSYITNPIYVFPLLFRAFQANNGSFTGTSLAPHLQDPRRAFLDRSYQNTNTQFTIAAATPSTRETEKARSTARCIRPGPTGQIFGSFPVDHIFGLEVFRSVRPAPSRVIHPPCLEGQLQLGFRS